MLRQSSIKALRVVMAIGYVTGGLGSAVAPVYADNRSLALLAAVPAVLYSVEMALRCASGARSDRDSGGDRPPPQR